MPPSRSGNTLAGVLVAAALMGLLMAALLTIVNGGHRFVARGDRGIDLQRSGLEFAQRLRQDIDEVRKILLPASTDQPSAALAFRTLDNFLVLYLFQSEDRNIIRQVLAPATMRVLSERVVLQGVEGAVFSTAVHGRLVEIALTLSAQVGSRSLTLPVEIALGVRQ